MATEIPHASTVASRLLSQFESAHGRLAERCAQALKTTTKPTTVVSIQSDEQGAVDRVMEDLVSHGYQVRRWRGDQRDPCDELHILV